MIPVWLRIMVVLTGGIINFRQLSIQLAPSSQSTVYKHLAWLESVGWVTSSREMRFGGMRIIRLTEKGVNMAKLCVELYNSIKEVEGAIGKF